MTIRKVTLFIFSERQAMFFHLESPKEIIISEMSSYKVEQRCTVCMKETPQQGGGKEEGLLRKRKIHPSWLPSHRTCAFPVPTDTEWYWTFPAQTENHFKCCLSHKKKKEPITPKKIMRIKNKSKP